MFRTLSLLLVLALTTPAVAIMNDSLLGPNWEEGLDDAGDKPSTAQKVTATSITSIATISGKTKGAGSGFLGDDLGDWQDVYEIFISDPANFSASTSAQFGGFAEFDSMMWLFARPGTGLLGNNNAGIQGDQGSILLSQSSNGVIDLQNVGPGIYYIAISGFSSQPFTLSKMPMFPQLSDGGDGVVASPTEEGLKSPLNNWLPKETPANFGDYLIRFAPNSVSTIPESCGESTSGNCYEPHNSPGCDQTACCSLVCLEDPYCCTNMWDQECTTQAIEICASCENPSNGSCDAPHKTPFCNDSDCCFAVCEIEPNCCKASWDQQCVDIAEKICPPECGGKCPGDFNDDGLVNGGDLGLLLAGWNSPGCTDLNTDDITDGGDLGQLLALFGSCSDCGRSGTGSCYETQPYIPEAGYVGCEDAACCDVVCTTDPACCTNVWDSACVTVAENLCSGCDNPSNGSCFESHIGFGCDDASCCEVVCSTDPNCCDQTWDANCVAIAVNQCSGSCGHPTAGDCNSTHPSPGCNDRECCQEVCEILPRCCEVLWDQSCVDHASLLGNCNP
jgi:hypothetical protein